MRKRKGNTRKFVRLHAPFWMKILTYNHKKLDADYCTLAEGVNVSPGGVSFKYPKVLKEGDHLTVLIEEMERMAREEILANLRIVWSEKKDILSRRFGAKFMKIAPEKKFKIMRLTNRTGGI